MMFGSSKPAASLSSGLLARKGQARPAMRPQGFVGFPANGTLEDLGWNDMGGEPAPVAQPFAPDMLPPVDPEAAPLPQVLRQRASLKAEFDAAAADEAGEDDVVADTAFASLDRALAPRPVPVEMPAEVAAVPTPELRPVSLNTAARIKRETVTKQAKAAFTLRLDAERHLRLRLASAVRGASAQKLVTEALDQFLAALPEVDALLDQLPTGKDRKSRGKA
ncbi:MULTISPECIES: hypothetical protein [unclassified Sphingomonas]|jgi:hypothetical protein|uniref:hypothetical protein n=1 Tax=unclassified Sphingomonas TaxID=196159 RepID=UPI000AEDFFEC